MKIRGIKIQVITQTYFWIKKVQTSILVQVYECLRSKQILHSCYLNKKNGVSQSKKLHNSETACSRNWGGEIWTLGLLISHVSDEHFNHLSYSPALHTGFEPAKPFSSTDFKSAPSPPGHTAYILESKFILISLLNAQTLLRGLRCHSIFLYFSSFHKNKILILQLGTFHLNF